MSKQTIIPNRSLAGASRVLLAVGMVVIVLVSSGNLAFAQSAPPTVTPRGPGQQPGADVPAAESPETESQPNSAPPPGEIPPPAADPAAAPTVTPRGPQLPPGAPTATPDTSSGGDAAAEATATTDPGSVVGQPGSITGWLSVLVDIEDALNGSDSPDASYSILDDSGKSTPLQISQDKAKAAGGIDALTQRRATVTGTWVGTAESPALQVDSISLETQHLESGMMVKGTQKLMIIACRFSDIATEPKSQSYFQDMFRDSSPGIDHYWREASYDNFKLEGSEAKGWYNLPQNEAYYSPAGVWSATLFIDDCTAAADGDVDFSKVDSIYLMTNSATNTWTSNTGLYKRDLDSVDKYWNIGVMGQAVYSDYRYFIRMMGYDMGLYSSSWSTTLTSPWDVMSWTVYNAGDATYGHLPMHPSAYTKDLAGWIPDSRKIRIKEGRKVTFTLERLAEPPLDDNTYLMAEIEVDGSVKYVLETRRQSGYDWQTPGDGVLISEWGTSGVYGSGTFPRYVVASGCADLTNDCARWTESEEVKDEDDELVIRVDSKTDHGYTVTVQWGEISGIKTPVDFNGDGTSDHAYYSDGWWKVKDQSDIGWGGDEGDIPVPGDYAGDGSTDVGIYRDGWWYIVNQTATGWGGDDGDVPVQGDYDGDGTTDIGIYRDGWWYIIGQTALGWGGDEGDIPIPCDYDGDGKTDVGIYRDGWWYIVGQTALGWGGDEGDIPVPGDYNGDGKCQVGIFRDGSWYIVGMTEATFGDEGDIPLVADYDGDGDMDVTVYRDGTFYVLNEDSVGTSGDDEDIPLPLNPRAVVDIATMEMD